MTTTLATSDADTTLHPPGPRGRRWLGNAPDYDKDRLGFLARATAEYGDVFTFSPSTIVVNDPGLIREVLVRSNTDFLTEGPLFRNEKDFENSAALVGSWMGGRRDGKRQLNSAVITTSRQSMGSALNAALAPGAAAGLPVFEVMRAFTGAMITEIVLGPASARTAAVVERRSRTWMRFMDSNLTYPKWWPAPRLQLALAAERRLDRVLTEHIRLRRGRPSAGGDAESLLDHLLTEQPDIDEVALKRLLKASLIASYGSPGATLTWVVDVLAEHPDVKERIAAEAAGAPRTPDRLVDPAGTPFTAAFVKEVLRLYPPTWLMGRTVLRPCELGGWRLQPGLEVMFSPYLVHRDARWWNDPEVFRPDRWLEGDGPSTGTAYLPFGAGPRACLGAQMATFHLVAATAELAAGYTIEITAPARRVKAGSLLLPDGLRARFLPR